LLGSLDMVKSSSRSLQNSNLVLAFPRTASKQVLCRDVDHVRRNRCIELGRQQRLATEEDLRLVRIHREGTSFTRSTTSLLSEPLLHFKRQVCRGQGGSKRRHRRTPQRRPRLETSWTIPSFHSQDRSHRRPNARIPHRRRESTFHRDSSPTRRLSHPWSNFEPDLPNQGHLLGRTQSTPHYSRYSSDTRRLRRYSITRPSRNRFNGSGAFSRVDEVEVEID